MAELQINSFSSYTLTDEEEKQGSIYTITQLQVLQNHLAEAAEQKLALVIDPDSPRAYIQQESFLTGKIDLINYLIDNSYLHTNPSEQLPKEESLLS